MADLIDRQDLIEQLDCNDFTVWEDYSRVFDMIDFAPTVAPKRGEWIEEREVERGITTFTLVKCSCCGQWALKKIYNAIQNLGEATLSFCPNCGADMRKPKEDE